MTRSLTVVLRSASRPKWVLDAGLRHQRFELVAGFIVAHHGQQRGLRAQGDHVVGHVGGTTVALFFARNAHHRHGRLRAEMRSTAPYQ